MRKRFMALAFILITLSALAGFDQRQTAPVSAQTTTGTIAYVVPNDTTGDQIWLVEPDGSNNRKIFQTGKADPHAVYAISSLVWRPDSGELVFASNHEDYCSWFASDLYAIYADGSGYRRVTNAPACAGLANYPKGTVTVTAPYGYRVYVMGAPMIQFSYGGTTTFDNVADLGNTLQPVVAMNGDYRWMGQAVDVKIGQPVSAGGPWVDGGDELGAFKPAWRSNGSHIGYAFGCASLYSIADQPSVGSLGQVLFNADGISPCMIAWGPTASTASEFVYATDTGGYGSASKGIYHTTQSDTGQRTLLIATDAHIFGIQYLPDASGLIISMTDQDMIHLGNSSSIYRYDFGTRALTQLTHFDHDYARDFSISPDGQSIIFERAPGNVVPYGGAADLWIMGIDGSNLRRLLPGGAHPTWSSGAIQMPSPGGTSSGTSLPYKVYLPLTVKK